MPSLLSNNKMLMDVVVQTENEAETNNVKTCHEV